MPILNLSRISRIDRTIKPELMPVDEWMCDPDAAIIDTKLYGIKFVINKWRLPLLNNALSDGWNYAVDFSTSQGWRVRLISGPSKNRKNLQIGGLWLDVPKGMSIDHYNRIPLDNRDENLSVASNYEQSINRRLSDTNLTGIRGITWDAERCLWLVRVTKPNSITYTNRFINFADALKAQSIEYMSVNRVKVAYGYRDEFRQAISRITEMNTFANEKRSNKALSDRQTLTSMNISGIRGIYWDSESRIWHVRVRHNGYRYSKRFTYFADALKAFSIHFRIASADKLPGDYWQVYADTISRIPTMNVFAESQQ